MEKKKYHWINEDIKIDFKIPKGLNGVIKTLEKMDLEENYAYFNWIEVLDCDMKEI